MKVLAICQEDPEYILGGMGRHVGELYKEMSKRDDVEIDLLVNGPEEKLKEYNGCMKYTADKLVCWKPTQPNMSSLLINDIQIIRTLMKLIAQGKRWDLVHVHEWNSVQAARTVRDALNIPMVGTLHLCISKLMQGIDLPIELRENRPEYKEEDLFLMQQEGHLIVDSDETILCSKAYVKIIRDLFMTDRKINMIYNGFQPKDWQRMPGLLSKVRKEYDLPDDRKIALFVGRIADMKGIRLILKAVNSKDIGYCLVLAGEINANTEKDKELWEVTQMLRKIERLFPERIRWVGFQKDPALKELYSVADVGLMPSIHEPFGLVALEFMSMGVPLISTEVDGLKEVVCDEDGMEYALVINPVAEEINQALEFLYDNEEAKRKLRVLGLQRVKDFSWKTASDKTVEIYKNLIRRKQNDCFNYTNNSEKFIPAESSESKL